METKGRGDKEVGRFEVTRQFKESSEAFKIVGW